MAPFPSKRSSVTTYPPPPAPALSTYPPSPSRSPPPHALRPSDPVRLFGDVSLPTAGALGALGQTSRTRDAVRDCLRDNHINHHTFRTDNLLHNHAAHHVLAAYSLGAGPKLIKNIYELEKPRTKPMPPLQPIEINESNWTLYLEDERFYPNFLAFFHRLISTPPVPPSPYAGRSSSVVPVLEKYLFGGYGDMLLRAVSGTIHPLIHIGHGIEFGLDALVAEGLAQCAVHAPRAAGLFDGPYPPPPPKPTQFQSTLTSAFSSLKIGTSQSLLGHPPIASSSHSFAATASRLNRDLRSPKEGLSGFTILERILRDPELAPGEGARLDEPPNLEKLLERKGERIRRWCEEWKFEGERSVDYGDEEEGRARTGMANGAAGKKRVPKWEEVVEKCEELFWMATVLYASTSRPGYETLKLDFFMMHGLTSVLFLPSILEVISPHLRPFLLQVHFRVLVSYWISRGRPELFIDDVLLSAPSTPLPPSVSTPPTSAVAAALASSTADFDSESETNPWFPVLASAADHPDDHVPKVIRSLAFAAMHFGDGKSGMWTSSLPGAGKLDGSIFIRAAGMTMKALGWAREGDKVDGTWDQSGIGFDAAWVNEPRLAAFVNKGKGKADDDDEEASTPTPGAPAVVEEETTVVLNGDWKEMGGLDQPAGREKESAEEEQERLERQEAEDEEVGLMA